MASIDSPKLRELEARIARATERNRAFDARSAMGIERIKRTVAQSALNAQQILDEEEAEESSKQEPEQAPAPRPTIYVDPEKLGLDDAQADVS